MTYTQHKDTRFILGEMQDRRGVWPDPDFLETGKPLAGCLQKGETIDQWYYKKIKREIKMEPNT
jgi:hypothetical protein